MATTEQQSGRETMEVAKTYFAATTRRDLDAMEACWAPGGVEHIAPVGELSVPGEYRAYFQEIFEAFPDFEYQVLRMIGEGDHVAVHWRATGTFTGKPYQGLEPNGKSGSIEGIDMIRIEDGKVVRNDVYFDSATFLRTMGVLPPVDSVGERATKVLFNLRTKVAKQIAARRGAAR
jgi:steroid delta-isomerase-like uncharacterized protein